MFVISLLKATGPSPTNVEMTQGEMRQGNTDYQSFGTNSTPSQSNQTTSQTNPSHSNQYMTFNSDSSQQQQTSQSPYKEPIVLPILSSKSAGPESPYQGSIPPISKDSDTYQSVAAGRLIEQFSIPFDQLVVGKELGRGNFGVV